MFSRSALVICIGVLGGLLLAPVAANAQEVCATPGTAVFMNLAETRTTIVPSTHRELSGLGRMAVTGGCKVVITCPVDPSLGKAGKRVRDRQCSAARAAMGMFERRSNIRSDIVKTFAMSKVNASAQWQAGHVYISLQ